MFYTRDNIQLDVIIGKAKHEKKCLVVWPCVGGNTRLYMIPVQKFMDMGYSVIQYNPRGHGNSGGQMSLRAGLDDFYYFLHKNEFLSTPIIGVGHSVGASALLQLNHEILKIEKLFLIEPSLDFRESILFKYKTGSQDEFIKGVSKYTNDPNEISRILNNDQWLDMDYWHQKELRKKINELCENSKMGNLLEESYIPGVNSKPQYIFYKDIIHTFLATQDTWYPIEQIKNISQQNNISHSTIEKAKDHYFYFAWNHVWNSILEKVKQ